MNSIAKKTALPKSLRPSSPPPENVPTHSHITNKKLRTQLNRTSVHVARSKALLKDAELLLMEEAGKMEVEGEMEKTWRVGQEEIVNGAGQEASKGRREWRLDGGPYRCRYTRNGRFVIPASLSGEVYITMPITHFLFSRSYSRHIAIIGASGHAATFDWQTGTLHTELQLQETCRDITYVRSLSPFYPPEPTILDFCTTNHILPSPRRSMSSSTTEMELSCIA
jgi:U3 small nucleolar RNA-associated protein 7